jgi:hypothetical protein
LLAPAAARAGDAEVWSAVFAQAAPTPGPTGLRLWLDLHARRSAAATVGLIRPGVGWQIQPWISLWAGYAWVPTAADDAPLTQEHRVWEQAIVQHKVSRVSMSLRLREEQRFRVGEPGDVSHRLRIAPRVGVQLAGPVSLQVWDEVFVAWNETAWFPVHGYDQNRFFIGPSFEGFKGFRVEVGYMNHHQSRGEATTDNHVAMVNLFFNFGPRAPKPKEDAGGVPAPTEATPTEATPTETGPTEAAPASPAP